ncbi:helix-turn-helix domain-containing protein [Microbacterium sp.]|uniref:helix-turn-helix domain-containing protein n=1 Tax=Microbacterium sp. TaxID=51671 RepID=UPI003FA5C7C4
MAGADRDHQRRARRDHQLTSPPTDLTALTGLQAAKAQGRVAGRPEAIGGTPARQAQKLRDGGESVPDIAKVFGVSIATVYRITKSR